jgi:hypothetical protein
MGNYITAADVKAEGVPSGTPDARIDARIVKWEAIVERLTRNVFRIISPGELTFDGNNSRVLHFNLPLVTVTSVKINSESTALDADDFTAFIGRAKPQDDRYNPRIKLEPLRTSIFQTTSRTIFVKGYRQLITATWGFVEPDDSTPTSIKDCLVRLVILDLDGYFEQLQSGSGISGGGLPLSSVRRERTDGHEIEYIDVVRPTLVWGMIPRDIMEVLALYRAPLAVGAPEPIRFYADPATAIEDTYFIGAW